MSCILTTSHWKFGTSLSLTFLVLQLYFTTFNYAISKRKNFRLPPQIAYPGKSTTIDLGNHFILESNEHPSSVVYLIFMYDDDVGDEEESLKLHNLPSWVIWNASIPALTINIPSDLNHISINLHPVYEFHIVAYVDNNGGNGERNIIAEERLTIVIHHKNREKYSAKHHHFIANRENIANAQNSYLCFYKCPKHFGIPCEDWGLWLLMAIVYGACSFVVGVAAHCLLIYLYNKKMNENRPSFIHPERKLKYNKLLNKDPDKRREDFMNDSDSDAEVIGSRKNRINCICDPIVKLFGDCYMRLCCLK